jgi:hypothetical protein
LYTGRKFKMGSVVGAVIGAGASMKAMQAQEKAMKAQQKAAEEQLKMQKMQDLRDRRKMLREAAIARGQTVNIAAQIGGGQGKYASSSLTTGLSGLQGQILSGLGFQQTARRSAEVQQKFLNKAAQYEMDASKWAGFGSMAQNIFGALPTPSFGK